MPGETILLADDSTEIQENAREVLENAGYNVIPVSNGSAALTYPDLESVDMVVLDRAMLDGPNTARLLCADKATFRIPVLLVVPKDEIDPSASGPLYGAAGYLAKPFLPGQLLSQVKMVLEEQTLREEVEEYLSQAADKLMSEMAEKHMRTALDKKAEILSERMVQHITTQVGRRVQDAIDTRITTLSAEKEDELIKKTVREVANSMVEKLAERKVLETIDEKLQSTTERTVKHVADSIMPEMIRVRAKEVLEYMLPKEINRRVQTEAESRMADVTKHMVDTIDSVALQRTQRLINEQFPTSADRHLQTACEKQIPTLVKGWVGNEIHAQMPLSVQPAVEDAVVPIRKKMTSMFMWLTILNLLILASLASLVAIYFTKAAQ